MGDSVFVVALIAALFGFGGIAGESAWVGQILLFVFLVLAVVSMVLGRRGPPVQESAVYRLLTTTCPTCQNRFHVGGETADPPDGREYRCRCPRCCGRFVVGLPGGVPQPAAVSWAVTAGPAE